MHACIAAIRERTPQASSAAQSLARSSEGFVNKV